MMTNDIIHTDVYYENKRKVTARVDTEVFLAEKNSLVWLYLRCHEEEGSL